MSASIHDKLNRVRKPRVHITYDVETEGAEIQRELPFVVGIMGDFSGDPTAPLRPLADRKFTQIDRDNFNDVMASMNPGLKLKVDNKLAEDGTYRLSERQAGRSSLSHKYGTMVFVRTTIDIPDRMYRRLKARAASEGRSARALILRAVERSLASESPALARKVTLPLVRSKRPGTLRLDNARIYDVISFP